MRSFFNRVSPSVPHRVMTTLSMALAIASSPCYVHAEADEGNAIKMGMATYYTRPKGSLPNTPNETPNPMYRAGAMLKRAAPSNQWYSSVMFTRWSTPLHAHPMSYQATERGFEIGYPDKLIVPTEGNLADILHSSELGVTTQEDRAKKPNGKSPIEVRYPHEAAITLSPTHFKPEDARLADASDGTATIQMGTDKQALSATLLHASPFSYYTISQGNVRIQLASAIQQKDDKTDARVQAFNIKGKRYAIFAPKGAQWEWKSETELILHLPHPANYFSIAALPDTSPQTLTNFLKHAYAFVKEIRAEWKYDEANSLIKTTFTAKTETKEGQNTVPLMGLYPHQWHPKNTEAPYHYDSIRGVIRVMPTSSFTTENTYHGVVPYWGKLQDATLRERLNSIMAGDHSKASSTFSRQFGGGTYWVGKALGSLTQLMNVAEQEGELKTRDTAMKLIKQRLEAWLDGKSSKSYFVYDKKVGTMIAYPDEFGSIKELNDHHFHYGYWILSAAQIALRDPNWASQWGGLIEKVIADIASPERTQSEFPYLRNFDPYEGHSWASGSALYADGNNQESSSEAINAWYSLILWGAATGNTTIRDLGIYLYSTEAHAIPYYWFNVHNNVFPKEYDKNLASFVFGGKYGTNTWWTEEPRQIHGINILPVTPASTYLGVSPEYIKKYHSVIDKAREDYGARGLSDFTPRDIWQDVLYSHLALADPEEALNKWNAKGSVEVGETRSRTLHWLGSLNEMGIPDFSTTANTALYSVFKQKNGKKTYLAFNPSSTEKEVVFSDGKRMRLSPNTLTRTHSTD